MLFHKIFRKSEKVWNTLERDEEVEQKQTHILYMIK